ncbi:RNA polymerase sigma-70 factor, ECF subfamily [Pedobacter steynii]|uniref:RNA polymerase sigma-70 factor, ECF subfamily n=1 Tax=Pedobacter steynii TaxID=430522 RepID=A0A1G9JVD7_9SPHI|nr:RNA polymerase sigma-70 factor [Pedobacter steynii]NQX38369.1 RNA polymerase sigma-70 factor [Pedobacter steynii]SDL41498.1 RNA polymerase sigma-70 factor, ECF subfamily [Pedobacter steynii]
MGGYVNFSDQELLEELRLGNRVAFTELFNRYWKKLLAVSYAYTKDRSSAEEIVQEVFIGLWNRKDQLNIKTLEPYLATAVKFSVFKSIHQQKRREELTMLNYQTELVALDEEKIHAKFLQEYIDGIVEQLPEKCRLVFKYSRNDGLSIPEIAAEMNIAEKTVEAHLTKALKTIKKDLNSSGTFLIALSLLIK